MPRRRNRGRKRRGGGSTRITRDCDWIGGTVDTASSAIIRENSINLPEDRPYRVLSVHYEVASAARDSNSTGDSIAYQIVVYDPSVGKPAMTDGPHLAGDVPRKGTIRVPYIPFTQKGSRELIRVTNLCLSLQPPPKAFMTYLLRVDYALEPEIFSTSCPSVKLVHGVTDQGSSPVVAPTSWASYIDLPMESESADGVDLCKATNLGGAE